VRVEQFLISHFPYVQICMGMFISYQVLEILQDGKDLVWTDGFEMFYHVAHTTMMGLVKLGSCCYKLVLWVVYSGLLRFIKHLGNIVQNDPF